MIDDQEKRLDQHNQVTVLVADDQPAVRKMLERALTGDGYRVITAEDGDQAWNVVQSQPVDIVISDIKMPKMGGFELLRKVKEKNPSTGFVVMTAHGDTFSLKDALLLGADEYLIKPFTGVEVSLIVERICWRLTSGLTEITELCTEDFD